jgi:hypothetical protein
LYLSILSWSFASSTVNSFLPVHPLLKHCILYCKLFFTCPSSLEALHPLL